MGAEEAIAAVRRDLDEETIQSIRAREIPEMSMAEMLLRLAGLITQATHLADHLVFSLGAMDDTTAERAITHAVASLGDEQALDCCNVIADFLDRADQAEFFRQVLGMLRSRFKQA